MQNAPCLVPGGKRFGEKINIMRLMLRMAWEEHGGRREDALRILARWRECIKLQDRLETQSKVWPHRQPLVSQGIFISLVGLLCPLRQIRSPWEPRQLEHGETDGHLVTLLPAAMSPLGGPAKVPGKGWFLTKTLWPPWGIAAQPARKRGHADRPGDVQTDRQHARGGTDKTAVS